MGDTRTRTQDRVEKPELDERGVEHVEPSQEVEPQLRRSIR